MGTALHRWQNPDAAAAAAAAARARQQRQTGVRWCVSHVHPAIEKACPALSPRKRKPSLSHAARQVRFDMQHERPTWPATCYAHAREGACGWGGDVSCEEARWAQLQAARAGRPVIALAAEMQAAAAGQNRLYQVWPLDPGAALGGLA